MSITKLLLLTSCGIVLSGCAHANSIHRLNGIRKNGQIEFVDAKQRAVIVLPSYEYNTDKNKVRRERELKNGEKLITFDDYGATNLEKITYKACSEPAPDVFSVYALAMSGELNARGVPGAGVSPADKELRAQGTMSSSEIGAAIARTQTINLMRESMFRTCERYMNGAIDADTMQIQAARDQRAMVAVLAIEQLTGVVKQKPTIISVTAQASLVSANSKLVDKYLKESDAVETAQTAASNAEEAFKKAQGDYAIMNEPDAGKQQGHCDSLAAVPTQPAVSGGVGEEQQEGEESASNSNEVNAGGSNNTATLEQCTAVKASVDAKKAEMETAEANLTSAKTNLEATKKMLETNGKNIQSTNTAAAGWGDGGSSQSDARIQSVAKTVEEITRLAFDNQTEMVFICNNLLENAFKNGSPQPSWGNKQILDQCLGLIQAKAMAIKDDSMGRNFKSIMGRNFKSIMAVTGLSESQVLTALDNAKIQNRISENALNCMNNTAGNSDIKKLHSDIIKKLLGNGNDALIEASKDMKKAFLNANPEKAKKIAKTCETN